METLQTRCCLKYLRSCAHGTLIPYADIPGTTFHWLRAWSKLFKINVCNDVVQMVNECIEDGCSSRIQVDNMFRRNVHIISETLGLNHGPKSREKRMKTRGINHADMTITCPPGWSWRVPDLDKTSRKGKGFHEQKHQSKPRRTLDQEYPGVRKMVEESLRSIDLCEDWEDKTEKLLWDGIGMETKCLPRGMRAECVQRLVVDGLLDEGYELW